MSERSFPRRIKLCGTEAACGQGRAHSGGTKQQFQMARRALHAAGQEGLSVEKGGIFCKVAVSAAVFSIDKPYDYFAPERLAPRVRPGVRVLVPFGAGNRRTEAIVLSVGSACAYERVKAVAAVLDEEPVLDGQMMKLVLWMRERLFCTVYEAVRAALPAGVWTKSEVFYSLRSDAPGEDTPAGGAREEIIAAVRGGALTAREIGEKTGLARVQALLSELVKQGILTKEERTTRGVKDKTVAAFSLAVDAGEAEALARRGAGEKTAQMRMSVIETLSRLGSVTQKELIYLTGASAASLKTMVRRGILRQSEETVYRAPYETPPDTEGAPPLVLNDEQRAAADGLIALLSKDAPEAALLFGVTGSGKTSVYLKLIEAALSRGEGAVLLVPEIALTPQMIRRFRGCFGARVAVLHSALSTGERYDEWKRIREGAADVVVGTRSAVFAPIARLGLIIIDEEQEHTYKSENAPRYHAHEIAKYRCVQHSALLVLGSATPSVESYYHAEHGRYHKFMLTSRFGGTPLPEVIISDMKRDARSGRSDIIGDALYQELAGNLARGEQSVLFLNRRGTNRIITCVDCGWVPACERCSVSLTYHAAAGRLMCHHCGFSLKLPESCPECGGIHLKGVGFGTQKAEAELYRLFPEIRVVRMDADTTGAKASHEKLLKRFERERADVLLGTQMITKGLDFENVTLVGVLNADMSLFTDDYRGGERTFSLITQVVGRAGRRAARGRAVIQTYHPENRVIETAARQDYAAFYEKEILLREALMAPPVCDTAVLTLTGEDEHRVLVAACALAERLRGLLAGAPYSAAGGDLLGPVPAAIARINRRYKYHISFRIRDAKMCRALIAALLRAFAAEKRNSGVALFADVNPEM